MQAPAPDAQLPLTVERPVGAPLPAQASPAPDAGKQGGSSTTPLIVVGALVVVLAIGAFLLTRRNKKQRA